MGNLKEIGKIALVSLVVCVLVNKFAPKLLSPKIAVKA